MLEMKWRVKRRGEMNVVEVFLGEQYQILQKAGIFRLRLGEYQLIGAAIGIGVKQMQDHLTFNIENEEEILKSWSEEKGESCIKQP